MNRRLQLIRYRRDPRHSAPNVLPTIAAEVLLGRPEQPTYSDAARQLLHGKRVLVTGSAGSIGSELVRQLLKLSPERVYRLDIDEGRLHGMQLSLCDRGFVADDEVLLADIRDRRRVQEVFESVRPEIVFHAAALKHLNLLERYPAEGVKTNVAGTHALVDAALHSGVERFINISTDKAADPTSVLGATKRVAELLVQANAVGETAFASVRFGNVLGSRGSFYDTMTHQIAQGRPVTVTHPEVTRFFMSIPEAVGLVVQASTEARSGGTYVLDMGQPVKIVDLVRRYAGLLGVPTPQITFTGLHPGEKLHEVLFSDKEVNLRTSHPRIWTAPVSGVGREFAVQLEELYELAHDNAPATLSEQYCPNLRPRICPHPCR